MSELFTFKNTGYNLRGGNKLKSNTVKTVCYVTESISYPAPKGFFYTFFSRDDDNPRRVD